MANEQDRQYMARAISLAENGLYTTDPNPRVGCVLVKNNKIIAEGWHARAGGPHAEIHALQQSEGSPDQATAYVSLEPCCHHGRTPPCTDALINAGIHRVVVGSLDPNPKVAGQGIQKLRDAGIVVEHGVLQEQADALNPGFMKRMRNGLPFVRCKVAMSIDGRTAMASGESKWITGEEARADVHHWRARSSAILTGIETVIKDDPSLNARPVGLQQGMSFTEQDQPIRAVLDTRLRMPLTAKTLELPGRVLVFTASNDHEKIRKLEDKGVEVVLIEQQNNHLDLSAVLSELVGKQMNEVLVEAGATLNGALITQQLIDELIFYIAPSIMGDHARGAFHLPHINAMAEKVALNIRETRQIGGDWRIIAQLSGTK